MPQEIQDLINKIKAEGVEAAQEQAKAIEDKARKEASAVLSRAQQESEKLMREAHAQIQKMQASAELAIQQAARDTLLKLRKEIEMLLREILSQSIQEALTVDHLATLIGQIAEGFIEKKSPTNDIKVLLNPKDLEKIRSSLLEKLQERIKTGIQLVASEDVSKGLMISFDGGKSSFDFTDASLVEYVSQFLNAELAHLLKGRKKP